MWKFVELFQVKMEGMGNRMIDRYGGRGGFEQWL